MATPMTAAQFIKALRDEGCKVQEHEGWATHNRNHKGAWGPLNGVMIHHTAGLNVESYVFNGSAELPGPLCHGYIDKKGVVHLIGWGRANHAGGGDPAVLEAVIDEKATMPATHKHEGSPGAVDGNARFVGYECENKGDGKDPWPAVQLEAMARAAAAVCRVYGWSERSVIRHMDWSDWKSDPKGVDWKKFQERVKALLAGSSTPTGPSTPSKPQTPPKAPSKPVVTVAHLVEAARKDPAAAQGKTTHKAEVKLVEDALVKLGYLDRQWADGSFGTKTVEAYARLQRHLGYSGRGADGVPGRHSLVWMSQKYGTFTVKG